MQHRTRFPGTGDRPLAELSTFGKWIGLGGRSGLRRTKDQALADQRGWGTMVSRGFTREMFREGDDGSRGSGGAVRGGTCEGHATVLVCAVGWPAVPVADEGDTGGRVCGRMAWAEVRSASDA